MADSNVSQRLMDKLNEDNSLRKRTKLSTKTKSSEDKKEKYEKTPLQIEQPVTLDSGTYWLTRIVYLRAISFIYVVGFLVALNQNKQLIGDNGLLPLQLHMKDVQKQAGSSWWNRITMAPTLLWFAEPWNEVNNWLDGLSIVGIIIGGFVVISGCANVLIMLLLWILYHSLIAVGQRWYGFGWESQLLETGLLAVWGVPALVLSQLPQGTGTPWVMIWGLRWLLVRVMLGAGLIKIRGDQCWRDLTCMDYHYETQPIPNPLAYYLHQMPIWWHSTETLGNHVVELVVPFFAFFPRPFRNICGIVQILFQVALILSGNLSFLNWLTIVPCLAFFDDRSFSFLFTEKKKKRISELQLLERNGRINSSLCRKLFNVIVALLIGYLSIPVVTNLLSQHQAMNTSFDPFRIVNTYGAFGSVTKERTEVIFEGTHSHDVSDPNADWKEYEFKCKPGSTERMPCWISPYHYRLDWLLWFAAFQRYEHNPWLVHLVGKLLVNDPEVSSLMSYNPFKNGKPPRFIRALHYKYEYTKLKTSQANDGHWFTRKLKGVYLPPVDTHSLTSVFKSMRWKPLKAT